MSQIQLKNILSISLDENLLSKNFQLLIDRISHLHQRLLTLQQSSFERESKVNSKFLEYQCLNKGFFDKLQSSAGAQAERILLLQTESKKFNEENNEINLSINNIHDIIDSFKLTQEKHTENFSDIDRRLANQQNSIDDIKKQLFDFSDQLKRRADKNEFVKLRKQHYNAMLNGEIDRKKVKEIEHRVQEMHLKVQDTSSIIQKLVTQYEQSPPQTLQLTNDSRHGSKMGESKIKLGAQESQKTRQKILDMEMKLIALIEQQKNMGNRIKRNNEKIEDAINNLQGSFSSYVKQNQSKSFNQSELWERISILTVNFSMANYKIQAFEEVLNQIKKLSEKSKSQVQQMMLGIREMNLKKLNESLKSVQVQLKLSMNAINEKLQRKVESSIFEKSNKAFSFQIQRILQYAHTKSDRLDVKKALVFIQNKIKQIVTIITEKQINIKDALLSKKLLHCLSCDKEIQKFQGSPNQLTYRWESCRKALDDSFNRTSLRKFKRKSDLAQ